MANKQNAEAGFAAAPGSASRLELLMLRYKARQLEMCGEMLDKANVPEWVMLIRNDGVPSNSTPCRLEWYLTRRKDVSESEIDKELLADMEANLKAARARPNDKSSPTAGKKP